MTDAATGDTLRVEILAGAGLAPRVDALAALRIAVFREWPYLYEGSRAYEARYLDVYLRSPRSFAMLVWNGNDCVGASTALPLADAGDEAQQPFLGSGLDPATIDYFGESMLLPAYRGRGLGLRFFEAREAHARAQGLSICAFCAVMRADDDPRRPAHYVGNESFWTRRGYRPAPEITTTFAWPDLGEAASTAKPMQFWLRHLDATR